MSVDCDYVRHFSNSPNASCHFVKTNADCQDVGGFINYVDLYYCNFSSSHPAAICISLVWLLNLFIALAIAADDFFCPSLAVISKTLRLSQNVAGVTILALGNGAPDIFSSLAGIQQARPELVLGELFGAGIFVSTAVAGAVCLTTPFKIMERPFLRDVTFNIIAGYWAFCIFYRGQIYVYDAVGFLGLYVVYIGVVLVGRFVNQRNRQNVERSEDQSGIIENEERDVDSGDVEIPESLKGKTSVKSDQVQKSPEHNVELQSAQVEEGETRVISYEGDDRNASTSNDDTAARQPTTPSSAVAPQPGTSPIGTSVGGDEDDEQMSSVSSERFSEWRQFWTLLSPIPDGVEDFRTLTPPFKIWKVLRYPSYLCLRLTIPVVDEELDSMRGWNQKLHVVQCLLAPIFTVLATNTAFITVKGNIVMWHIALLCGQTFAILLLCTSKPNRPPRYQSLLAAIGFVVSIVWIYVVANEIVSLLKLYGVIFGLSDAILGLTILAWGNSIGDLVPDVSIARAGFPRMGYSACFGGPLFNLVLGIGIPFLVVFARNGFQPIAITYSAMVLVLGASFAIAMLASFVVMPLSRFRATRKHGIALLVLYCMLLTASLVVEFTVVKKNSV